MAGAVPGPANAVVEAPVAGAPVEDPVAAVNERRAARGLPPVNHALERQRKLNEAKYGAGDAARDGRNECYPAAPPPDPPGPPDPAVRRGPGKDWIDARNRGIAGRGGAEDESPSQPDLPRAA